MSQEIAPTLEEPKKSNTGLIIGIIVAVLVVCLCCCLLAFVVLPAIFGPSIGNVFSNIIEGLEVAP